MGEIIGDRLNSGALLWIPRRLRLPVLMAEAWIVGSTAELGPAEGRDLGILIPWGGWSRMAREVPTTATPNSCGGWKWTEVVDGHHGDTVPVSTVSVDMWPDDLGRFLVTVPEGMIRTALHVRTGKRWVADGSVGTRQLVEVPPLHPPGGLDSYRSTP